MHEMPATLSAETLGHIPKSTVYRSLAAHRSCKLSCLLGSLAGLRRAARPFF